MKRWLILYVFTCCIATGCGGASSVTSIGGLSATTHAGRTIRAQGVVRTGQEIGTDYHLQYCSEPLFLDDSSGNVQIKPVSEGDQIDPPSLDPFLGKSVDVTGTYTILTCNAICFCDAFIAVDSIAVIE